MNAFTFLVMMSLFSSMSVAAEVNQNDAQEIVQVLLGMPMNKYNSEVDGKQTYDPLKAMHGWGALYNRYHEAAEKSGKLEDIKVYLLIGTVAHLKSRL